MNKRRKILLGIGATSAMAAWYNPIVSAVVLPAHAETSPPESPEPPVEAQPPPPVECPAIVIGAVAPQALSGADAATSCGITFDIFSSDPNVSLMITAITDDSVAPATVTNDGLGLASATSGPRVTWIGPIVGAAPGDCVNLADIVPAANVTFTITATCTIDGETTIDPEPLVMTLTDILAIV